MRQHVIWPYLLRFAAVTPLTGRLASSDRDSTAIPSLEVWKLWRGIIANRVWTIAGRDKEAKIREKRGDTQVKTLRETYGPEFAPGFRSDAKLEIVRERTGKSLSELIHDKKQ